MSSGNGATIRCDTNYALPTHEIGSFLSYPGLSGPYVQYSSRAEHPIGTLSPCGTSIVNLPAEFEPLTVAQMVEYLEFESSCFPPCKGGDHAQQSHTPYKRVF